MNEMTAGRKRWAKMQIRFEDRYDWKTIQSRHDNGEGLNVMAKSYGMGQAAIVRARKEGLLVQRKHPRKPASDAARQKISDARKLFLKLNPDKHPWRRNNAHISMPCELFKKRLTDRGIDHIPEFQPNVSDRNFSIDVAFPEKMVAVEINGTQHYEKDLRTLKPYYQNRHDLLVQNGWRVYEILFRVCYNETQMDNLINEIVNDEIVNHFDYATFMKDKEEFKMRKMTCDCGKRKSKQSAKCLMCYQRSEKNKFHFPSEKELYELVWSFPLIDIAKKYKVSDVTVKNWCKRCNLKMPPTGHWLKKEYRR